MATETHRAVLGEGSVAELAEVMRGLLIRPDDGDYDEARAIWNAAHDRRPVLIARCAGVADVMRAIEFARSQDLMVAVRGGGHSIPGFSTCDGGMVIDLSALKGVRVDPGASTVRAQAGLTWGELDHETQAFALAVTGGLVSTTGIAGFTLGGGIGWLMRKHGLACDNVLSADVVTADGWLLTASADAHPDLLWALRGGGGNFGVVTSFEYRVHPVGPVVAAGPVFYPGDRAAEVLGTWRELAGEFPDELTTLATLLVAPPAPFLPERWHGRRLVGLVAMYAGPPTDGLRAIEPLRRLGDPVADLIDPMPYVAIQRLVDEVWTRGAHNHFKAGFMRGLDDAAITTLVRFHDTMPSPVSEIHVHHMGGAVGRAGAAEAALGGRDAPFLLNIVARTPTAEGFDETVEWARDLHAAMQPALTGASYVNFLSSEGDARIGAAYGPQSFRRLTEIKRRYDPENVFRLNQNIPPRDEVMSG
jgi:FAD/FMN-containing dehydrogenase